MDEYIRHAIIQSTVYFTPNNGETSLDQHPHSTSLSFSFCSPTYLSSYRDRYLPTLTLTLYSSLHFTICSLHNDKKHEWPKRGTKTPPPPLAVDSLHTQELVPSSSCHGTQLVFVPMLPVAFSLQLKSTRGPRPCSNLSCYLVVHSFVANQALSPDMLLLPQIHTSNITSLSLCSLHCPTPSLFFFRLCILIHVRLSRHQAPQLL